MSVVRAFSRKLEAMEEIYEFTAETFRKEGIDPSLRPSIDVALEELFTNIVKYGHRGGAPVRVEVTPLPRGVEISMTEEDAERFDPTRVPELDTTAPLEQRLPGGMGIHLVRKLVDSLEYRYSEESRQGRVTFRKTVPDGAGEKGEKIARD